MSYRVVRADSTPNPNAVKLIVEPSPGPSIRSYFNREQAANDPLAAALFAIPGVTNVMIQPTFITVNKAAEHDWGPIRRAVERVLADA